MLLGQDHKNNNLYCIIGVSTVVTFFWQLLILFSLYWLIEYCSVKRMACKISCIVDFWLTFEFSPSVAGCWTGGKEEQKGGLENSSPREGSFDKR